MKYLVFSIKKILIPIFIILYTLYFILNTTVLAQQISLGLTPPLLEVFIKPGKSIMIAYTLDNSGDPVSINPKVVSFEPRDNFGGVTLKQELEGPIRFSLDNADIQLEKPFFLKSSSSQQLLLKIRVPPNTPNGDYYYSLLAQTIPSASIEGVGSTRAKGTIGSNILITVTDSGAVEVKSKVGLFDVLSKFKITLFKKPIKIFDSFDKIPIILIISNKGKNLIKAEGKINLKDSFGLKSSYDIIPKNILASSDRLLEATPSAIYDKQPTTLTLSGFFIGSYSLSTNINFGENSPQIFASTSFFGFPFKITVGIVIVLLLIVFIIRRFSADNKE